MAVNKNFVVKNGLEVNDNLLVADQTTQKVGIGTSVSSYTLHVRGGIGATEARITGVSTFVGDVHAESQLSVTGVTTLASAGGITTTGGDLYIGGDLYVLDDVVYDEVNGRNIYISGVSTFVGVSSFLNNVIIAGVTTLAQQGGITTTGGDLYVGGDLFVLDDIVYDEVTGRNINISGISTFVTVDINGNLEVAGITSFAGLTTVTTNTAFHTKAFNVAGVSTFNDDININGAAGVTSIRWDRSQLSLEFLDETKASSGLNNDLQISHTNSLRDQNDSEGTSVVDGWTSYINEQGTGGLVFKSNGNSGEGAFQFFDTSWRPIVRLFSGASARAVLYWGGIESFETTGVGATVHGNLGILTDLYVGGNATIGGDLSFDELTARNANITGLATAANLHVGAGGTVINATDTGTVQIGSATTLATVTINGGSVPSVGLVIALGG